MEKKARFRKYSTMYKASLEDPEGFWGARKNTIEWAKEPTIILDQSNKPFYSWFPDG